MVSDLLQYHFDGVAGVHDEAIGANRPTMIVSAPDVFAALLQLR